MSANSRQAAIRSIISGPLSPVPSGDRDRPLSELYASGVFNDTVQRQRLPKNVYRALRRTIDSGEELPPHVADAVANAMKDWAIENGATHFSHWFQPMTGLTAEKHDSFIGLTAEGKVMLEFSGKELIKGEPDASSLPSGGIRGTFEARGYTAWDPNSPAFLRESTYGSTLIIPTVFCSWTGEALDTKTPLLRSCEALDKQARRLLSVIGDGDVKRVFPTVGAEQEYFLIDSEFYFLRPDLISCGRTLFGARPPKGQELEDHYFGVKSQRVLAFMMDLERELWKLGIPVKTRHAEVAPSQFEMAPYFEQASIATDHNMLTMELLQVVADRHGLQALLHEKPYDRINGSGKHNNWSLADDNGRNLLEPGNTPHENLVFTLFLTAIIRAVDMHQDLLRASVAHAGNDHRLGANEAPPAIVSISLGSELENLVESLIKGVPPASAERDQKVVLGVSSLPPLPRDTSDRNRTSPFAFTGNKFELRAAGSSQSIAYPNLVINSVVAESLDYLADEIGKRAPRGSTQEVIQALVRETLTAHQRVLYSGDNYSGEWTREAEKRGLLNLPDTPAALECFASEKNVKLFERYGVFTRRETESRSRVMYQAYCHRIHVEAMSTGSIAATSILPASLNYQKRLADTINSSRAASPKLDLSDQEAMLGSVVSHTSRLKLAVDQLREVWEEAGIRKGDLASTAIYYRDKVLPAMSDVRAQADQLELLVDDELWPLPKYREMLFVH